MRIRMLFTVLVLLALSMMSGCRKPYQQKVYKTVAPNQTAYLIPLQGANKTNQGKLDSEAYLEEKKVSAKRIEIRTKWLQTGRLHWEGKYITLDTLVVVDRTPVTRAWEGKSAIRCESAESVEWRQNVSLTVFVEEDDASKFLYKYGGKKLETVVDTDVKAMVSKILSREFSKYSLVQARTKKTEVYSVLEKEVKTAFAPYGITVRSVGASGGFNYVDNSIQLEINKEFASTLAAKTAKNNATAAKEFAKASAAMEKRQRVENLRMLGEAQAEAVKIKASKWNGAYPANVSFFNADGKDLNKFMVNLDSK